MPELVTYGPWPTRWLPLGGEGPYGTTMDDAIRWAWRINSFQLEYNFVVTVLDGGGAIIAGPSNFVEDITLSVDEGMINDGTLYVDESGLVCGSQGLLYQLSGNENGLLFQIIVYTGGQTVSLTFPSYSALGQVGSTYYPGIGIEMRMGPTSLTNASWRFGTPGQTMLAPFSFFIDSVEYTNSLELQAPGLLQYIVEGSLSLTPNGYWPYGGVIDSSSGTVLQPDRLLPEAHFNCPCL